MGSQKSVILLKNAVNAMTVVILILVVLVFILTAIIFQNPNHAINPFPPPTMPARLVISSAVFTTTALPILPTDKQTETLPPVVIETKPPEPSPTQISFPTSTPSSTPAQGYHYQLQGGAVAITASIFDSDRQNCSWMGVAGQVHDMQDRPVTGILVLMGGRLEGETLDQITMTGTALNYGPAGYEFQVTDHVVQSSGSVWVQLVDQSYIPLSAKVYFDTYADEDCGRNLIIINFKQVR